MSFSDEVIQTRNRVLGSNEYQVAINALRERADAYKVQTTEKQIENRQDDLEK